MLWTIVVVLLVLWLLEFVCHIGDAETFIASLLSPLYMNATRKIAPNA